MAHDGKDLLSSIYEDVGLYDNFYDDGERTDAILKRKSSDSEEQSELEKDVKNQELEPKPEDIIRKKERSGSSSETSTEVDTPPEKSDTSSEDEPIENSESDKKPPRRVKARVKTRPQAKAKPQVERKKKAAFEPKATKSKQQQYFGQVPRVPKWMLKQLRALIPEAESNTDAMIAFLLVHGRLTLETKDRDYVDVDELNRLADTLRYNDVWEDTTNAIDKKVDRLVNYDKQMIELLYRLLLAQGTILTDRLGYRRVDHVDLDELKLMDQFTAKMLRLIEEQGKAFEKIEQQKNGRPIR